MDSQNNNQEQQQQAEQSQAVDEVQDMFNHPVFRNLLAMVDEYQQREQKRLETLIAIRQQQGVMLEMQDRNEQRFERIAKALEKIANSIDNEQLPELPPVITSSAVETSQQDEQPAAISTATVTTGSTDPLVNRHLRR